MAEAGGELDAAVARVLGEKVRWLIDHKWPPGVQVRRKSDGVISNASVIKAISEVTGETLDRSTVWKLREGRNANPQLKTLRAFRIFFKLPSIGYFDDTEEAELINDLTVLRTLLEDKGIPLEVLRSLAELPPDDREVVTEMIKSLARRQQRAESSAPGPQSK